MTVNLHITTKDLVGSDATSLAQRLSAAPLDSADSLVLEFDERARLDESGLALLVRLYSHLARSGRKMFLSRVPPEIMATFLISCFIRLAVA